MIEISDIKKSGFSYEDVTDLMHESFNERLSQGLQFTCSAMTASSYGDRVKDCITLVAIDSEPFERKLIGTATLHIRKKVTLLMHTMNTWLFRQTQKEWA